MANVNPNIRGDIGYKELFTDSGSGQSGSDAISAAYSSVQSALAEVKANPGDPSKLMELQMQMNTLQQLMSTFSQMIQGLKSSTEGINRNIS
jgi:t-SNARE complex subunit (syntaxin)